jgi:hypothetical protein
MRRDDEVHRVPAGSLAKVVELLDELLIELQWGGDAEHGHARGKAAEAPLHSGPLTEDIPI